MAWQPQTDLQQRKIYEEMARLERLSRQSGIQRWLAGMWQGMPWGQRPEKYEPLIKKPAVMRGYEPTAPRWTPPIYEPSRGYGQMQTPGERAIGEWAMPGVATGWIPMPIGKAVGAVAKKILGKAPVKGIPKVGTEALAGITSKRAAGQVLTETEEAIFNRALGVKVKPPMPVTEAIPKVIPEVKPPIGIPKVSAPTLTPEVQTLSNDVIDFIKQTKAIAKRVKPARTQELARKFQAAEKAFGAGQGMARLNLAKAELRGELPFKHLVPDETAILGKVDQLADAIAKSDVDFKIKLHATIGLKEYFTLNQRPQPHQLRALKQIFGEGLPTALAKEPSRVGRIVMDILGIPRSVQASFDLSATLRQGIFYNLRFPDSALVTFGRSLKALGSEKYALALQESQIKRLAQIPEPLMRKVYNAPLAEIVPLGQREEMWMTSLLRKIPLFGRVFRASERHFVTFLNEARLRSAEILVPCWKRLGATEADWSGLGDLINIMSGRGNLPSWLRSAGSLMNATCFAPRLLFARFQLPAMLLPTSKAAILHPSLVQKEAMNILIRFLLFGSGVLGAFKLSGAKVDLDRLSSDFGKVIIGNSRLDFWAGYAQMVRFGAQIAEAKRRYGGRLSEANRLDLIYRFTQSKASPAAGILIDVLRGRTYIGEEMEATPEFAVKQAADRLMPFFIRQLWEAIEMDGLGVGLGTAPLGILGVGISTYKQTTPSTRPRPTRPRP